MVHRRAAARAAYRRYASADVAVLALRDAGTARRCLFVYIRIGAQDLICAGHFGSHCLPAPHGSQLLAVDALISHDAVRGQELPDCLRTEPGDEGLSLTGKLQYLSNAAHEIYWYISRIEMGGAGFGAAQQHRNCKRGALDVTDDGGALINAANRSESRLHWFLDSIPIHDDDPRPVKRTDGRWSAWCWNGRRSTTRRSLRD